MRKPRERVDAAVGRQSSCAGSALLHALYAHRAMMAPHQKERRGGELMMAAIKEIERLIQLCTNVHDRLLRGDDDRELLEMLEQGWKGPNVVFSDCGEKAKPKE